MPTVYVIAVAAAGKQKTEESKFDKYKSGANKAGTDTLSSPVVPLGGADDAAPTHYGFCWPVDEAADLGKEVGSLKSSGVLVGYQVVPVKEYDYSTHWVGWLAGLGLKPRQEPVDSAVKK